MKNKLILISIIILFVIFFIMVFKDTFFNKKKELSLDNYVNLDITSVKKHKTALILNDTIAIRRKSYRVFPKNHKHFYQNYYKFIESINKPYHLFKDRGSDTLMITKSKDTFFYKLDSF